MPDDCDIANISIEEFLMGITALEEELTLIPASLLHGPRLQKNSRLKHSVKDSSHPQIKSAKATGTVICEKTEIESRGLKRKKNEQAKEVQHNEVQVCPDMGTLFVKTGCQLPQQTQVEASRTLLDISNGKLNLQETKRIKPVMCTTHNRGENSVVIEDTSCCAEQCRTSITEKGRGRGRGRGGRGRGRGGRKGRIDESTYSEMLGVFRLPEPVLIRKSARQRKKNYSKDFEYGTDTRYANFCEETQALESVSSSQQTERDNNRTKKKHISGKDEQYGHNTKRVRSASENKQCEAVEPTETLKDISVRELGRMRKPSKKAPRSREVIPNKDEKQESGIRGCRNVCRSNMKAPQAYPKNTLEPSENLSADKLMKTEKRTKEDINSNHDIIYTEPLEKKDQAVGEDKQSTSEDVEVRAVKRPRGRPRKNLEPSDIIYTKPLEKKDQAAGEDKQSTSEVVKVRAVKRPRGRPRKNLEPSDIIYTEPLEKKDQATGEDKQSTSEDVEVRAVERPRGKPRKNLEPSENITEISTNIQLRKSTRERRINYMYGEESFYEYDENKSWLNPSCVKRIQNKTKAQKSTVNTSEFKKSNIQKSTKLNSKKLPQIENLKLDEKLKKRAIVKIESLKDKQISSMKRNQEGPGKEDIDSGSSSTEKTKNINKKSGKKSAKQVNINKKLMEKTQPETAQNAEDFKITAKKGTLKYLQQRKKYMESLAKEVQVNDDFCSGNPFFAKKKYKFSLLPPSHEETLTIVTPKREKNKDKQDVDITPRTVLLGQLQPLTPTTQPYSPSSTMDTNIKQDALRQVYRVMKGKKRQPQRAKKALQDTINKGTSRQNLPFTPLELPTYQETQSGNESGTSCDEYFNTSEEL